MNLGERLRRHRLEAGLTQEELAGQAGLSLRAVSDLERGIRRYPYPDTVQRLANALGLDADERSTLMLARRNRISATEFVEPGAAQPGATGTPPATWPGKPMMPLPVPLSSFVGREQELVGVRGRLKRTRLLTLVGFGGVGKTRLALRIAAEVWAEYADGL